MVHVVAHRFLSELVAGNRSALAQPHLANPDEARQEMLRTFIESLDVLCCVGLMSSVEASDWRQAYPREPEVSIGGDSEPEVVATASAALREALEDEIARIEARPPRARDGYMWGYYLALVGRRCGLITVAESDRARHRLRAAPLVGPGPREP